jgi:hypothetical protein
MNMRLPIEGTITPTYFGTCPLRIFRSALEGAELLPCERDRPGRDG